MRDQSRSSIPELRASLLVTSLACIIAALMLGVLAGGAQAQNVSNLPQAKFTDGGPEACLKCHGGPAMTLMADTVHGDADNPHAPFGQESCESCHGPGSFHVSSARGGVGFPPLNAFKHVGAPKGGQFDTCLGCHAKTSGDRLGIGWIGSVHDVNGLSCSTCHEVHAAENMITDVTHQRNLCAGCHGFTNSKHDGFEDSGVRLERLTCSTCHKPHDM